MESTPPYLESELVKLTSLLFLSFALFKFPFQTNVNSLRRSNAIIHAQFEIKFYRRVDPAPLDDGQAPGPQTGAAGLSPWLFSHLDRNWVRKEMIKAEY